MVAGPIRLLSWQHRRKRHFAIERLLENIFNGGTDLGSIRIDNPNLLALLEWAARHDLKQHALVPRRVLENFGADRVGLSEIGQELQLFLYTRPSHGEQNRQSPKWNRRWTSRRAYRPTTQVVPGKPPAGRTDHDLREICKAQARRGSCPEKVPPLPGSSGEMIVCISLKPGDCGRLLDDSV